MIDLFVLFMCVGSLFLCLRALVKGHLLKRTTHEFFDRAFGIRLGIQDKWEFLNLWYAMIVVNDVLLIAGTVCKASIQFRDFDSALFTLTGVLLGLGVFLVFFGLLRYFTFFSQYNVIILTLRKSLPSILRFLVCAVIIYCGFLFAGWVIIGPYSLKFRTLAESSEALFSLLNGDDMFATFYTINGDNAIIKLFGTVYIYLFVSLFIYVVLSLFIAIIMDAYEVVKNRHNPGLVVQRSTLHEFLASSETPRADTEEARELFAADQLLRLESNWPFMHNFPGVPSLRNPFGGTTTSNNGNNRWHQQHNSHGRPAVGSFGSALANAIARRFSNNGTTNGGVGGGGAPYFDYQSFENTTELSRASTHNDMSMLGQGGAADHHAVDCQPELREKDDEATTTHGPVELLDGDGIVLEQSHGKLPMGYSRNSSSSIGTPSAHLPPSSAELHR